jgi:hypothetical protein
MNNYPGFNAATADAWQKFVISRRGYGTTDNIYEPYTPASPLDPSCLPTEFPRPFRSAGSSFLTPPLMNSMGTKDFLAYNREINATLLRAEPATAVLGTDTSDPFQKLTFRPLFESFSTPTITEDTYRNPAFRYKTLERMANLTTTRSNVYAVWITVGYFEVSRASVKPWINDLALQYGWTQTQLQQFMRQIYLDGYELGQELGSDTGEIERHRGFYIIDRSIPVGFQRGQDLNAEKAFLLKRVID